MLLFPFRFNSQLDEQLHWVYPSVAMPHHPPPRTGLLDCVLDTNDDLRHEVRTLKSQSAHLHHDNMALRQALDRQSILITELRTSIQAHRLARDYAEREGHVSQRTRLLLDFVLAGQNTSPETLRTRIEGLLSQHHDDQRIIRSLREGNNGKLLREVHRLEAEVARLTRSKYQAREREAQLRKAAEIARNGSRNKPKVAFTTVDRTPPNKRASKV